MEDAIKTDLKQSYGLACARSTALPGGWLNRLWKVDTDAGELLVKQYSNERFTAGQLQRIECALQRQRTLARDGVCCPHILTCDGRVIRLLEDGTAYMVMDFVPGHTASPETITNAQMHSLGSACALMHRAFSRLPTESVAGYPLAGHETLEALWAHHATCLQGMSSEPKPPPAYIDAVHALVPILEQLDVSFFERLPKSIAHEDFTSDNVLFDADGVTAIIDFDRNQYSYPWHDIGRALLSFALGEGGLCAAKLRAFCDGYAQHAPLSPHDMADALRISWCIEVPWWIQPDFFRGPRGKASRFLHEVLWLTQHWAELDAIVGC